MSDKKQRREKPSDDGGGPSAPFWMVTYSDMVTLLLTFFVMLLAMANFEDPGRVEAVFESIRLALGVDGVNEQVLGVDPVDPQNKEDVQEEDKLQPIMSVVSEALAKHLSDDMVVLTNVVNIGDELLASNGCWRALEEVVEFVPPVPAAAPAASDVDGDSDGDDGDAPAAKASASLHGATFCLSGKLSDSVAVRLTRCVALIAFHPAPAQGLMETVCVSYRT